MAAKRKALLLMARDPSGLDEASSCAGSLAEWPGTEGGRAIAVPADMARKERAREGKRRRWKRCASRNVRRSVDRKVNEFKVGIAPEIVTFSLDWAAACCVR